MCTRKLFYQWSSILHSQSYNSKYHLTKIQPTLFKNSSTRPNYIGLLNIHKSNFIKYAKTSIMIMKVITLIWMPIINKKLWINKKYYKLANIHSSDIITNNIMIAPLVVHLKIIIFQKFIFNHLLSVVIINFWTKIWLLIMKFFNEQYVLWSKCHIKINYSFCYLQLLFALTGGHPCPDPDEMLQIEGCNLHGCHGYSWMALPWQPCNGTCDREGYQIREVYCSENQQYVSPDKWVLLSTSMFHEIMSLILNSSLKNYLC